MQGVLVLSQIFTVFENKGGANRVKIFLYFSLDDILVKIKSKC